MRKIFLLGLIFIVKISFSFSQSNQPIYIMPTILSNSSQKIAAGSLVLTKDSCSSYLLSSILTVGSNILATPKTYAFANSQSGNYYLVNRKLNGSSTHTLGMLLLDGTSLWRMGIQASVDTNMAMIYTPTVGASSLFSVYRDSVIAKCRSRINSSLSNKLKITQDSAWISMGSNHSFVLNNLGQASFYKQAYFHDNITSLGKVTVNSLAINKNVWISDTTFHGGTNNAPIDTITGTLNLSSVSNVDISNSSTPMNNIYLKGVSIHEGTNARMGTAVLSGGTKVISNTSITANTRVFLTLQSCTNCGVVYVSARVVGTSFTINSSNVSDASTVAWCLIEPN